MSEMKILFITLSNIGDCILTLPVLDRLKEKYPLALITCLVPPRPREIFINNPLIDRVVIFDKQIKLIEKIKLFFSLSRERFDLVVDLRNSFFGAFLPAKQRSSPWRFIPKRFIHSKDKHLFWAGFSDYQLKDKQRQSLNITSADNHYIEAILNRQKFFDNAKLIVVAPGSRSQLKCWSKESFSQICGQLVKEGYQLILVGDQADQAACVSVKESCPDILDLCAKTTLSQLAALLKKARLLITNDSAVMHLASYLNVPVVAIFGPTDEKKYGPWSEQALVIKKDLLCRPCEKALCRLNSLACLSSLKPEDVFSQIKSMLEGIRGPTETGNLYRRILIVRTDRIGDVLLSTPVIKAVRKKFPQAYICLMVAPHAREIVEANPYLDEVIIYDKDAQHKSWWRTIKFAARLKNKKFDLAIILHPTNRVHWLTFLAEIPQRLGYDRKFGFLLTQRKKHLKQQGLKHEAEYNFDLISDLGVTGNPKELFMSIKPEAEKYVEELFKKEGIGPTDKLLAINPGASCPSKIWSTERFAQVAEKLASLYNLKIIILSGPREMALANKIVLQYGIKGKVVNLAGKTSISQLASILRRCVLFISNDSGPIHLASAIGTPVISIFGRKQAGLGPKRWGPLGKADKIIHQDVGCIQCLAHNCQKDFACLKAISVDDVILAAESILKMHKF